VKREHKSFIVKCTADIIVDKDNDNVNVNENE